MSHANQGVFSKVKSTIPLGNPRLQAPWVVVLLACGHARTESVSNLERQPRETMHCAICTAKRYAEAPVAKKTRREPAFDMAALAKVIRAEVAAGVAAEMERLTAPTPVPVLSEPATEVKP